MERLLELVIDLVKELPELAIWVLVILFGYKIAVVGSAYGLIRYAISKLAEVLKWRRENVKTLRVRGEIDAMLITMEWPYLKQQLERLRGINVSCSSEYIHRQSIQFLEDALTEKLEREKQNASDRS
jgi:hypothetical protein